MTKNEIKSYIKKFLYEEAEKLEGESKSYWFTYQIIIEMLIELLHAGFPDINERVKIIRETCDGVIKHIKEQEST